MVIAADSAVTDNDLAHFGASIMTPEDILKFEPRSGVRGSGLVFCLRGTLRHLSLSLILLDLLVTFVIYCNDLCVP